MSDLILVPAARISSAIIPDQASMIEPPPAPVRPLAMSPGPWGFARGSMILFPTLLKAAVAGPESTDHIERSDAMAASAATRPDEYKSSYAPETTDLGGVAFKRCD